MPTLDFKGKQIVYAHHLGVPYRTLDVARKKSVLPKGGGKNEVVEEGNLVVHGDNLQALKALMPRYAGRVNCIYIDPPYNTGKEGWMYNDNVNSELMRRWLKDNGEVDREDPERHDKWLCMMWPRLQLLRELLTENGAIFVSIDDNEQHRLRMVMDEIFGEDNFVANIIWQKKYSPANDAKYFSDNHDFVLCYAKRKANNGDDDQQTETWQRNLLPRVEKQNKLYKYDDNDDRGPWRSGDLTGKSYTPEYDYPIANPKTGKTHDPSEGRSWITSKEQMQAWIEENRVFFGRDGKGKPQLKRYLREVQQGVVPLTIWPYDEVGHTDGARKLIKSIFSDRRQPFDNPKALGLLKRIITLGADKDAIILDSFAGSGTTAQAVLELNKEDGGNRKFILVECEDYADSITAERVRRVIKGVPGAREENLKAGLGGHFAFCTLGKELNIENLITGKSVPPYDSLARHVAYIATGVTLEKIRSGKDCCFGETEEYRLHMIYRPDITFLRSPDSALTMPMAERIGAAAMQKGKTALVFAPWKFVSQKDLTKHKVTFCQLPYAIHRLFGD